MEVSIPKSIAEPSELLEVFARRAYFYVGGSYDKVEEHKSYLQSGPTVMTGQMYVERLIPHNGVTQKHPLIFMHGGAQTGTNWLNTPDGRQGWASYFLKQGYAVYITDQPHRGRSAAQHPENMVSMPVGYIEKYFTATKHSKPWPSARLHTQWPGTGHRGNPAFDAFYATQVPFQRSSITAEQSMRAALTALLARTGPAILITHSQSGAYGWATIDSNPTLVKAIIAIEPSGPPFEDKVIRTGRTRSYGICNTPLTYDPPVSSPEDLQFGNRLPFPDSHGEASFPLVGGWTYVLQAEPARKLVHLENIPILVVTSESGYHSVYDFVTVEYLRQAGAKRVKHMELEKEGIRGNGHFMFMELNNLEIARRLDSWIREAMGLE
ncbi:hypothetical protein MMC14_010772 [Varicellaria rhodocarpa]|nr:hypothetical protein [Varicellaria rhodocarpa]